MYDVKDYGAAGLGVVDDGPAILRAVTAVGWKPGTLLFSDGVFLIDSPLYLQPNITLEFDGACLALGPNAQLTLAVEQAINVKWFGANGTSANARGDIAAGSGELHMPGAFFYVGNPIAIYGAGRNGEIHFARVLANNGTALTLDTPAMTSVTGAVVKPADCVAFQQALAAHPGSSWFYALDIPKGIYQTHQLIEVPEYTSLTGAGRNNTIITLDPAHVDIPVLITRGGDVLRNFYLLAQGSGACIQHAQVINDNLYTDLWLGGNPTRGAMIGGEACNNLTITNAVFENGYDALQLAGNYYLNLSQSIFFNMGHRSIVSTRGGIGLNISNAHLESVSSMPGAVGIDIADYKSINLTNVVLSGTTDNAQGISLARCDGVRGCNVQFDGFVAAQRDRIVLEACSNVGWND
jgi:hypothetical protein